MKKHKAVYTEMDILYWPTYEVGLFAVSLLSVLGAISLIILVDAFMVNTDLGMAVVFFVITAVLLLFIHFALQTMYIEIKVSQTEILYKNKYSKAERQIRWDDVAKLFFWQDSWHGAKTCRIHLKKSAPEIITKESPCDFVLPVSSVDEKALLRFVPISLWGNFPWKS